MLLTSVNVTPTGVVTHVKHSREIVTQSVIKAADVMDMESATVTSVPPTPIVLTTDNAYVTNTGAERIAASTQVNATQSVRNVRDQRHVIVLSVLAMPIVMKKEPAAVSTTGQAMTALSTIKASVTPNVAPLTQTISVLIHWLVAVTNVLNMHTETNITKTVNVMTTGVMKTVSSTLETAQSSVLDVMEMEKMSAMAVSLATMISDDSSENPK